MPSIPQMMADLEGRGLPVDAIAESDERDGQLFRFWIRAASYPYGWPAELTVLLANCHTPAEYRIALTLLAARKRVNLP